MKITINDHRTIFAIQKEFNEMFPYLKIEFFVKPSKTNGSSPKNQSVQESKKLGDSRTIHNKGTFTIAPDMTVAELERNFNDVYGLSAQVFRISGNAWLETTVTDSWSLKEQNEQGESLTKFVSERKNM